MTTVVDVPDPRQFPPLTLAPPADQALYELAAAALAARTGQEAEALTGEIRATLRRALRGEGDALAATFAGAPSVPVARKLWRTLDAAWCAGTRETEADLAVTVFALPLVVVVGLEDAAAAGALSGVLADPAKLAATLMEHGCMLANRSVALANVLVGDEVIGFARLPELLALQRLSDAPGSVPPLSTHTFVASTLAYRAGTESVHLRFLLGSAIAKPGLDILVDAMVGAWGAPLTRELGRQLGRNGVSVLALARAPQNPVRAVHDGRVAQREVAAQVFASNAIRRLRERVGEPVAVLSAHHAPDAPGGGELRLSLSSPLEPRDAEGFRCPLYALDRVDDVANMLVSLLEDCRVADIRVLRGVHPDRAAGTGSLLLFKPDTVPADATGVAH